MGFILCTCTHFFIQLPVFFSHIRSTIYIKRMYILHEFLLNGWIYSMYPVIAVIQGTDKDTSKIHSTHTLTFIAPQIRFSNTLNTHRHTDTHTHPTQHHQSHTLLINEECTIHLDWLKQNYYLAPSIEICIEKESNHRSHF